MLCPRQAGRFHRVAKVAPLHDDDDSDDLVNTGNNLFQREISHFHVKYPIKNLS